MKNKRPDRFSRILTKSFGILLLLFGFIGFYTSRSWISLVSGGIFGLALIGCSMGMKKHPRFYILGALSLITVLMATFFFRAIASHKILPTIFGSLSLCVFLILFFRRVRL